MHTEVPPRPPVAPLLSVLLCVLALVGCLLPLWDSELIFSIFGRPNAHSGHTGAWAGVASFLIYVSAVLAAAAGAVVTACVAAARDRRWIWLLAAEIAVLGVGIWASFESVSSGEN